MGTTTFTYDVDLQSTIDSGTGMPTDSFQAGGSTYGTLYDITGFVSYTLTPATAAVFTPSAQLIGITPSLENPPDSPLLTNITLTYKGATTTSSVSYLLGLTVVSTSSSVNPNGVYTGQDIKNTGGAAGTVAQNIGFVAVPSSVPEPATLFSFAGGAALLLFGGLRRRFVKQ